MEDMVFIKKMDEYLAKIDSLISGVSGAGGLKLKGFYSGSTTATHTDTGKAIVVSNDGDADLTVSVNDIDVGVKAGEIMDTSVLVYDAFTSITITTTVAYRLWVYE